MIRYQVEPEAVRPPQLVRHEPPVTLATVTIRVPDGTRTLAVDVVLARVRSVTPSHAAASVDEARTRAGSTTRPSPTWLIPSVPNGHGRATRTRSKGSGDGRRYNLPVSRFFSLDDANALVPELAVVVGRLRSQRDELIGLRDAYRARESVVVGDLIADASEAADDDAELRRLRLRMRGIVDQMQADVSWLDERSIVLRDISTGLLDFPALVSGRQVWLCWRLGEEAIAFWHGHDDGFAGRRPLANLPDEAARA